MAEPIYRDFAIVGDLIVLYEDGSGAPDAFVRVSTIQHAWVTVEDCPDGMGDFRYTSTAGAYSLARFTTPDEGSEHFSDYMGLHLGHALLDALVKNEGRRR